ncbi:MAG TPA: MOSC domain-containing protein [Myxococcota bacterium]|nr:MOSC domain-containing protein [Myxococcota bacterium]
MQLKQLAVHPLKSGRGQAVEQWPVGPTGLVHDRSLMLVDPMGRFVTLRGVPRMVLFKARTFQPDATSLTFEVVDRPELGSLTADLHAPAERALEVEIWGEWVLADHLSTQADVWFSDALGQPVRLVALRSERARQVDPRYAALGDLVGLADGFPILVTATASLESLSQELGRPVPMERFRPNLVIETDTPWIEDRWRRIRVGPLELELVKPCARCVGVNVDPETATSSREPLKTLARTRTRDGKVHFGQNAIHRGVGLLSVGDEVEVLDQLP